MKRGVSRLAPPRRATLSRARGEEDQMDRRPKIARIAHGCAPQHGL